LNHDALSSTLASLSLFSTRWIRRSDNRAHGIFARRFLALGIAVCPMVPVADVSWLAESIYESLSLIQRRFKGGRTPHPSP
jgi:hypothetical protein